MSPFLTHYFTLSFAVGIDIREPFPKSNDLAGQSLPATDVGPGDEAEFPGGGGVRPEPALNGLEIVIQMKLIHIVHKLINFDIDTYYFHT